MYQEPIKILACIFYQCLIIYIYNYTYNEEKVNLADLHNPNYIIHMIVLIIIIVSISNASKNI